MPKTKLSEMKLVPDNNDTDANTEDDNMDANTNINTDAGADV